MADNIKIVGNIINSSTVSRYSENDVRLISSQDIQESFGGTSDYIEYYVYDIEGNLLNTNYNYLDFKLPPNSSLNPAFQTSPNIFGSIANTEIGVSSNFAVSSSILPIIEIDPVKDLQNLGYSSGEFKVQYNFFNNKISSPSAGLFIKEISADRTELRVGSTVLTNEQIESSVTNLINNITGSVYFYDFLLNFGVNTQVVGVNVALNKIDPYYEIFFKLYEPLPINIDEKTSLWVVEEKVNPYIFDINLDRLIIPAPLPQLRGPNFDIETYKHNTVATPYQNYTSLISGLQAAQSSSYRQLMNLMSTQSIDINIDYTDFNNFVFFSSAESRVRNFYTKVKQIEDYNNVIRVYSPLSGSYSSFKAEINTASASLNDLITNFDGFETFLYFESGSVTSSYQYGVTPWPKATSTKPYALFLTASNQALTWSYSNLTHSINYDLDNTDYLKYAVPSFVVDDPDNAQYITFLNMVGQYFDNVWIFLKAVTDINLANNNLDLGVSKDLVYDALQSLGINVYNQFGDSSTTNFLLGNSGSANWDNDFTSTGSYLNAIPHKDLLAESYKRIYHNLPLLLKSKGTVQGLNTLISTFGISSETYYTLGSGSFYTTTGSAVTSSILNVKEFGGATKTELLAGYNNDKIRIVNTTVTGSVLSPYISLQTEVTESSKFRNDDEHYVDISFSPQNQIDTYISQSISSSNPNWVIDNYIGDPRQLYSGSYNDLITQKDIYFRQGTGSFKGFTGSLLDYNGFIRLIQYFDNSLFKMLKEYVPARANLSTGVTINSPVLERNKWSYANPRNTSNEDVHEAEYQIATIEPIYGTLYDNLSGSKAAFYNGEISGSNMNLYQNYFIPSNYNPYLQNFNTWNSQHTVSQSINLNTFAHSDFNVLLNNVTGSVLSSRRKNLEISGSFTAYIGSGSIPISYSAQLQDSNLSLESYKLSRYEGVKIYSLDYNNYTSASTTYGGDISYGKTAVIDHYTRKIGLFTQITSSVVFTNPNRNNVVLKYLVDEFGGLTELNQRNKHWEEIQNTFKSGKNSTISLFNNQQYSNQKSTDGSKLIFNSGYSYSPILYFKTGSVEKISFSFTSISTNLLFKANNDGGYFSGSTSNTYQIKNGNIYNLFNVKDTNFSDGNAYYSYGSIGSSTFPTYSISQTGNYSFTGDFGIGLTFAQPNQSASYIFRMLDNNSNILATTTQSFNSSLVSNESNTALFYFNTSTVADSRNYDPISNYYGTVEDRGSYVAVNEIKCYNTSNALVATIPVGATVYTVKAGVWGYYTPYGCNGNSANGYVYFQGMNNYIYGYNTGGGFTSIGGTSDLSSGYNLNYLYDVCGGGSSISVPSTTKLYSYPAGALSSTININLTSPLQTFTSGSWVSFQLSQSYNSTNNYTASLLPTGNGTIYGGLYNTLATNQLGTVPYATSSESPFISGSTYYSDPTKIDTFILNGSLSAFYNYLFLPGYSSGSQLPTSSLYSTYGDVDYNFTMNAGDRIIVNYYGGSQRFESEVANVYTTGSKVYIHVSTELPSSLAVGSYGRNLIDNFIILSKLKDETNMILTFNKRDGKTSYGFIIPDNLSPEVLANIDIIQKEVKQKLLNDPTLTS